MSESKSNEDDPKESKITKEFFNQVKPLEKKDSKKGVDPIKQILLKFQPDTSPKNPSIGPFTATNNLNNEPDIAVIDELDEDLEQYASPAINITNEGLY